MADSSRISYKWQPIEDLPASLDGLEDLGLEGRRQAWEKQKHALTDTSALTEFNSRLAREWSIETGVIEGIYALDRGTTQQLIERGITSSRIAHDATNKDPELVSRIIHAHQEVLEGLFAFVKQERELSTSYIKEVHAALLRYQDAVVVFDSLGNKRETELLRGDYKRYGNSPVTKGGGVHEYCPPEHVASEMDRLIEMHRAHQTARVPPVVEAAWLHHRFSQIHPFQDGNGRVARALASIVLIRGGFFPLVITRDSREVYIDFLERADSGDLSALTRFFADIQQRALAQAMGLVADMKPVAKAEDALEVAHHHMIDLGLAVRPEFLGAKVIATSIYEEARRRFQEVQIKFNGEIGPTGAQLNAQLELLRIQDRVSMETVKSIASELRYEPNLTIRDEACDLTLNGPSGSGQIIVSIQGVGPRFEGRLVALTYYVWDGQVVLISDSLFEIRYDENPGEALTRFQPWLEHSLIEGIARWRRSLE